MSNEITPSKSRQLIPIGTRHPVRDLACTIAFRIIFPRRLAADTVACSLPDALLNKIAHYTIEINNTNSPEFTERVATRIFQAHGDESISGELKKEASEAKAERSWEKNWGRAIKKYNKAINNGDKSAKEAILKALAKTKSKNRDHENILIDKIFEEDQLLRIRLKEKTRAQTSDDKVSQEDITPLTQIAARRYAKMKQEAAKPQLHVALKAAAKSGLITIIDLSACAFIINKNGFKQLASNADSALHIEVVNLINWLLLEDVDQAQALWNAVTSHSDLKSDAFKDAKAELSKHLVRCDGFNSDRWKGDPKLNERFCTKWANFALDTESVEAPKSSRAPISPRALLGGVRKITGFKSRPKKE